MTSYLNTKSSKVTKWKSVTVTSCFVGRFSFSTSCVVTKTIWIYNSLLKTVALQLLFEQDKNADRMGFWSAKREMVAFFQEDWSKSTFTQSKHFGLFCVENGDRISRKLDLPYDKNDNTRNPPEELRRILKMVSSKSFLYTSKGAAKLINNICDYLWSKEELYNDL